MKYDTKILYSFVFISWRKFVSFLPSSVAVNVTTMCSPANIQAVFRFRPRYKRASDGEILFGTTSCMRYKHDSIRTQFVFSFCNVWLGLNPLQLRQRTATVEQCRCWLKADLRCFLSLWFHCYSSVIVTTTAFCCILFDLRDSLLC